MNSKGKRKITKEISLNFGGHTIEEFTKSFTVIDVSKITKREGLELIHFLLRDVILIPDNKIKGEPIFITADMFRKSWVLAGATGKKLISLLKEEREQKKEE